MLNRLLHRPKYHNLNQITLSSAALRHNYHYFQRLSPHALIAPVLKSNAYGHGLVEVAQVVDDFGAPFLIVDSLHEAYQLHKKNIRTPILIMGFTHPDNFKVKRLPFHTVVYDLELIALLQKYQPHMKLHLKIDTGMNRQGIRYDELPEFLEALKKFPKFQLDGLCTHFADADNAKSNHFTEVQVQRFLDALKLVRAAGYKPTWVHTSATSGAVKIDNPEINMVRLGLGLYGISPLAVSDAAFKKHHLENLQPVLQLETSLAQIKRLAKGETVGYNNTFTATKNMTVGVLPIGYYDGVDRRLSNTGSVFIDGVECPILGRVSMNITTVDITDVPEPHIGQIVTVYSNDPTQPNSVQHAATLCKTIPYELLVHLTESMKRVTV